MKILRVTKSMKKEDGGVVEAINQTCIEFNRLDNRMDVLCLESNFIDESYKIYTLGGGVSSYGFSFKYVFWLLRNAKKYDLIIIDGLWTFLTFGGYILKLMKIKYCVFTHGMLDPYFNEDRLKYYKKLPFWLLIERNVIALSNSVIFTCIEESNLAEKSFPFYRGKPVICSLGVKDYLRSKESASSLFSNEYPDLKNKYVVLFLSRVDKKKGIDLLIDAVADLKDDSMIPSNAVFVIAGPSTDMYRNSLEERAKLLGVDKRFKWLGMLTGDLKWGAFISSKVFILPSHQENFGIVVAESLLVSTPVLITNKVNIWREIAECKSGFVANDDVQGVKELLLNWFSLSSGELEEMKISARESYNEKFSIDSSVKKLEVTLKNIING